MNNLVSIVLALNLRQKVILGIATLSVVAIAGFMMRQTLTPNFKLLYAGLENGTSGEVIAALEQKGVAYKVKNLPKIGR